ncbi:MAG: metallophosphatase [Atopobiaceae bacterium]|nr:metallophosphatase [Atopobiaceae bacterium]
MGVTTYVTGDIHGSFDIGKLLPDRWPVGQELRRCDYLFICGDFGLVWNENPPIEDRYFLGWLNDQPWTTLFIDGNHENHDLLDSFPVSQWHGGKVHVLPGYPNLIHLMRGQLFDMGKDGLWFTMGGAWTRDSAFRIAGNGWWPRELPSDEEYAEARANLDSVGWSVDYVFTHECPRSRRPYAMYDWYCEEFDPADKLSLFLDEVDERIDHTRLKRWYSGHYHADITLGDVEHAMLYRQIVPLGELPR